MPYVTYAPPTYAPPGEPWVFPGGLVQVMSAAELVAANERAEYTPPVLPPRRPPTSVGTDDAEGAPRHADKKQRHNETERRRVHKDNEVFDDLVTLVLQQQASRPTLFKSDGVGHSGQRKREARPGKRVMLTEAMECINALASRVDELEQRCETQQGQLREAATSLADLSMALRALSAPPVASRGKRPADALAHNAPPVMEPRAEAERHRASTPPGTPPVGSMHAVMPPPLDPHA